MRKNIFLPAKAKRCLSIRPPTGGGPRPDSPTVPEKLVLDNLEGRPSLCGIVGGIDTAGKSFFNSQLDNTILNINCYECD